jgi:hypothetical protein
MLATSLEGVGYADFGVNRDIASHISDPEYYRDVYLSRGYIRERWSKHFDILDIIEGTVGNIQNVVILRARLTLPAHRRAKYAIND